MSPKKAILLTILGILAAWLIIRGIQAWESRHSASGTALPQNCAVQLCDPALSETGCFTGIRIF